jgi:hypothetical protein
VADGDKACEKQTIEEEGEHTHMKNIYEDDEVKFPRFGNLLYSSYRAYK